MTSFRCDTCEKPGLEFCTDCLRLVQDCNAQQVRHDCPDCEGHGPRHDEGVVACAAHAPTRGGAA